MKSHDVRNLRFCAGCKDLGDKLKMVQLHLPERLFHGKCYLLTFGIKGALSLPSDQQDKLTLDDLGIDGMRAILAAREERTS